MTQLHPALVFYVGWDVGGWNCDKNGKSRDAIVILDSALQIVGKPWRGNLRATINAAIGADAFVQALFALCGSPALADLGAESSRLAISRITLAVDTPLGFSQALVGLATGMQCVEPIGQSNTNPYLFRCTERFLFEHHL